MFVESVGPKFVKIAYETPQKSVYAFIEKETGDILRPATWRAPAKHARGNLANEASWTCAGPYGVAYLR